MNAKLAKWNELRKIAAGQGDHYAVSRITRIMNQIERNAWKGVGTN